MGQVSFGTFATPITTSRVKSLAFEQVGNTINGQWDLAKHRLVVDYDSGAESPSANVRITLRSFESTSCTALSR